MSNVVSANYGTDLAVTPNADGILDIQPTLQYATGLAVLVQSLICRQMCVRGSIIDSPNEGLDLRTYVRQGLTQQVLSSLPSVVQKELLRDERVLSAVVTGSYDTALYSLTLTEALQTTLGPFTLTLAVTSLTVALINQSP